MDHPPPELPPEPDVRWMRVVVVIAFGVALCSLVLLFTRWARRFLMGRH